MGNIRRVEWVDIGKYICIMFVMFSHLQTNTIIAEAFYKPFYLTVFFFLAGYVYKEASSFKVHILKKAKGLLLPWFIFSNFNILLSAMMTFKSNHNLKGELFWNAMQIRGHGDGLWFIAALFVAFIPFYFVVKNNNVGFALSVSFILSLASEIYSLYMPKDFFPWGKSALPWHIEYIFKAMLWMVLGYYFRRYFETIFDKYNTLLNRIIIVILYLVVIYSPLNVVDGFFSIPIKYISSFLSLLFIISICKIIRTTKYISYVGANTLIFFALHGKVYSVIEQILSKKVGMFYALCLDNVIYSSLLGMIITFVMSVVLIIPAYCINEWLPWTLGRKK